MAKNNKPLRAAVTGLVLCTATAQAADKLSFSAGVSYLSGDYGQTLSTDILYIPFGMKKRSSNWTFGLTVPYLEITGPGGVLPDLGPVDTAGTTRTTSSGLGDIIASAGYHAYYNAEKGLLADVTVKVKLPSADPDKGLGTGKVDYYGQLDLYKLSGAWTPFATLGYKVIGDTDTNYRDVFYASLGVNYSFNEQIDAGLQLYGRQRITSDYDPREELTLFASRKLDKQWKLSGYLMTGFSDASPDWGAGASVGYSY